MSNKFRPGEDKVSEDVEGHGAYSNRARPEDAGDDDVEGHGAFSNRARPADAGDDDVEGHMIGDEDEFDGRANRI